MSRMPESDMLSVRGMGVAVIARWSTWTAIRFNFSLADTPKRCSSSTTSRPRSRKPTSFDSNRWVPITMSTVPLRSPATTCFCCFGVRNRDSSSTSTGNGSNLDSKTRKCCAASTVVGARTATCLPSIAALNAALSATSVLPNPTSPASSRSIGADASMSAKTSRMARAWSAVSVQPKPSSNSSSPGVSAGNAYPWARRRFA